MPGSVDPAAAAPHDDVIALGHLRLRWPILAAAPMVGQSDPAYRALMRRWGATLVYTAYPPAAPDAPAADAPAVAAAADARAPKAKVMPATGVGGAAVQRRGAADAENAAVPPSDEDREPLLPNKKT